MRILYGYAVLAAPTAAAGIRGLAGEPLATVECAELCVAYGLLPEAPVLRLDVLRRHDATVRALGERCEALLPMRFGQIFAETDSLRRALELGRNELHESIAAVRGCRQMTLHVPDDVEPSDADAQVEEEKGPGTRYLRARMQRRLREREAPAAAAPLLAELARFVRAERVQRAFGKRPLARIDHLVRMEDLEAYADRVSELLRGRERAVRWTGPSPPYAFAGRMAS